jgi:hypothetical protein
MARWIVANAVLATALAAWLAPVSAQAVPSAIPAMATTAETVACNAPRQRRLLPNGKFEDTGPQDCYPDLHSAPMSNAPPEMANPPRPTCRTVQERVLQPSGTFRTQLVQRCS